MLVLLILPVASLSAGGEAKMEVDKVLVSFPQEVPSGQVFEITAQYSDPDYRIVMLIPPEGIEVNNSLTPIVFSSSLALPGAVNSDPVFRWRINLTTDDERDYRFRLVVISSSYSTSLSSDPRANAVLVTARVQFGKAYLHEVSLNVHVYNVTGIKKRLNSQISSLQAQVSQLMNENSQLRSQVGQANEMIKNLTTKVALLNATVSNLTRVAINEYWWSKAAGFFGTAGLFLFATVYLPYLAWHYRRKRMDELLKARRPK